MSPLKANSTYFAKDAECSIEQLICDIFVQILHFEHGSVRCKTDLEVAAPYCKAVQLVLGLLGVEMIILQANALLFTSKYNIERL